MKVLVADDDISYRHLLTRVLERSGYTVETYSTGQKAWERILENRSPLLAVLDWTMDPPDGMELCRRVSQLPNRHALYVMLLSSRSDQSDVVHGLESGADDYLTKPCHPKELIARMRIAERLMLSQEHLTIRIKELEEEKQRVCLLQDLLPMCTYCKAIRTDSDYWEKLEHYMSTRTGAQISHGICPPCYHKLITPQLDAARRAAASATGGTKDDDCP